MYIFKPDVKRFPIRFDKEPGGDYQIRMRELFIDEANKRLKGYNPREPEVFQIGFETEFNIVNFELEPANQLVRDGAIDSFSDKATGKRGFVGPELGASQIEIQTSPIDVKNQSALLALEELRKHEGQLANWLWKQNAYLLRIGANPLIPISEIKTSIGKEEYEKYQKCPKFHEDHQRPQLKTHIGLFDQIDVRSAKIPGITNSVQINLDCYSIEDAIEILNRALVFSPIATLLGSNAGFINCTDSGYADLRYIAWLISHDIRTLAEFEAGKDTRVGIPSSYYQNLDDYLSSVISHPFFMEKPKGAFDMGIGTYWRDARIKFLEKPDGIQIVVELRPLSTQPTVEDDFSLLMFYLGRIFAAFHSKELLPPIESVRKNKESAMIHGRQSKLAVLAPDNTIQDLTYKELMPIEIQKAMRGLSELGVDKESIIFVRENLERRFRNTSPIDHFRSLVYNKIDKGCDKITAIKNAIYSANLLSKQKES